MPGSVAPDSQATPATVLESAVAFEKRRALKDRVQRHVDHLEALTRTLKSLGVGEAVIEEHITSISDQYRSEMLRNINRI
jgi:hypothetical protein